MQQLKCSVIMFDSTSMIVFDSRVIMQLMQDKWPMLSFYIYKVCVFWSMIQLFFIWTMIQRRVPHEVLQVCASCVS
jgi:hypothetical protein